MQNKDDLELLSKEITSTPIISKHVKVGLIIIAIFIGFFVMWSLLSPIDTAAVAQGRLVTDSNIKIIDHLEGGIVKAIYVKDGYHVKPGQVLIELNDTQAKAAYDLQHTQANELLATEARLKAQQDNSDTIKFPKRLIDENTEDTNYLVKSQTALFKANKQMVADRITILKQRINQIKKEIASLEAQVVAKTKQLELFKEEIDAVAYLEKKKLIEKPRLLALKRESARLQGDKDQNLELIAKAEQSIGETESQIIATNTEYLKNTLDQLAETQLRLGDVLEREKASKDIYDRTKIRSPVEGKVVNLAVHTIGGVISPGSKIMTVVPSQDNLIIEARINTVDIDAVHTGLTAKVQILPFRSRNSPILEGKVTEVSADSLEDPKTGAQYYSAKIFISNKEIARLGNIQLQSGMPAEVMIIVDHRTPFHYFTQPLIDSFRRSFREQ